MKYYLGIDLGGTNIAAGVVDENFNILAKHSAPTGGHRPFETVVADMAHVGREAVARAGLTMDAVSTVGVGTPSSINPKTGLLVWANNLGWHNVPLHAELKKHFTQPVYIRNDADCAAYGEALAGSAREYDDVLMLTLGTGLGGGIIIGKKIYSGGDRMGGELGHVTLVYNGIPCTCGRLGCIESYASATALIRQTREAAAANPGSVLNELCGRDPEKINGRTAFDAAREGDETGKAVVRQYIEYLGASVSSLVTIFRPQVVVLGGGISHEGENLLRPLQEILDRTVYAADEIGAPPVLAATLGNDAGIIGAAMLQLQQEQQGENK